MIKIHRLNERTPHSDKGHLWKPTANIIFIGKYWAIPFVPQVWNPSQCDKEQREIKGIKVGKEVLNCIYS